MCSRPCLHQSAQRQRKRKRGDDDEDAGKVLVLVLTFSKVPEWCHARRTAIGHALTFCNGEGRRERRGEVMEGRGVRREEQKKGNELKLQIGCGFLRPQRGQLFGHPARERGTVNKVAGKYRTILGERENVLQRKYEMNITRKKTDDVEEMRGRRSLRVCPNHNSSKMGAYAEHCGCESEVGQNCQQLILFFLEEDKNNGVTHANNNFHVRLVRQLKDDDGCGAVAFFDARVPLQ